MSPVKPSILAFCLGLAVAAPAWADPVAARDCTSVMNYGAHALTIFPWAYGSGAEFDLSPLAIVNGGLDSLAAQAGVPATSIQAVAVRYLPDQCSTATDPQIVACRTYSAQLDHSRAVPVVLKLQDGREVSAGLFEGDVAIQRVDFVTVDGTSSDYELKGNLSGVGDNHLAFYADKSGLRCTIR